MGRFTRWHGGICSVNSLIHKKGIQFTKHYQLNLFQPFTFIFYRYRTNPIMPPVVLTPIKPMKQSYMVLFSVFYSWVRLINRTPSQLLWELFSDAANNTHRWFIQKYPPLSIARYSVLLVSEPEQSTHIAWTFYRSTVQVSQYVEHYYIWITPCICIVCTTKDAL